MALAPGLVDVDGDGQGLRAAAVAGAAHRRRAEVIEADGDTDMGVRGGNGVGGVEPDPAQLGHERLRPGVAGVLLYHAIGAQEVAGDEAGRHAAGARAGDEDVRIVLADAAAQREGIRGGGARVGRIGIEGHVLVDLHQQSMQEAERVVVGLRPQVVGERPHLRIDLGQRGGAQEEVRRKALVRSLQDAAGVMGFDQALDIDGEIGDRAMGQDMSDVAVGVLMHLHPRVGGDEDLPVGDILPVIAARRHADDLDHAGGGRLVAIGGRMGDTQAHDRDVTSGS